MLVTIFLFIIIVTTVSLIIFERKQYNTMLTPFTFLAIPYLIILIYQIIVVNIYRWYPISPTYLFYIYFFLLSFYLVGAFSSVFYRATLLKSSSVKVDKDLNNFKVLLQRNKYVEVISLGSSLILLVLFVTKALTLSNIGMLVQEDFQTSYTSGINFYLRLFSMIGTVYFWGLLSKENKNFFVLGLICFLPNFLTFVKGISYILILGSVIANIILSGKKLNPKKAVLIPLLGIILFFSVYLIEIGIWDIELIFKRDTYELIFAKLNLYLIAGIQAFNVNVTEYQDTFNGLQNPVYAPIANILAKVGFTERIETINNVWVDLGYISNFGYASVNTNTYIGTLVLYCGPLIGLLVNSLIAALLYYFFIKALIFKKPLDIMRYSLFVTGLVLGWFEYYYMHMFWVYLILIFFILKLISKYKFQFRIKH